MVILTANIGPNNNGRGSRHRWVSSHWYMFHLLLLYTTLLFVYNEAVNTKTTSTRHNRLHTPQQIATSLPQHQHIHQQKGLQMIGRFFFLLFLNNTNIYILLHQCWPEWRAKDKGKGLRWQAGIEMHYSNDRQLWNLIKKIQVILLLLLWLDCPDWTRPQMSRSRSSWWVDQT